MALLERCSLTTARRRRENPFAVQCTKGIMDEEQINLDLIEGYLRVKHRNIVVHNFRSSLKFNTLDNAVNLE
jgi:hypothetical protein